jgi:hypothetical protein
MTRISISSRPLFGISRNLSSDFEEDSGLEGTLTKSDVSVMARKRIY